MKTAALPSIVLLGLAATVWMPGVAAAEFSDSLLPPHAPLEEGKAVPVVPHPDQPSLLHSEDEKLAENKRLVYDMWRTVMNAGHVEAADEYLAPDYIQHNPTIATGREAFKEYVDSNVEHQEEVPETIQDPVVTLVAEGDYVVLATVTEYPEPDDSGETYTSTHFDLFRIEDGLIAEHWDSVRLPAGLDLPAPEEGGPQPVVGVQGLDQLKMLKSEDPNLFVNKRLVFDTWRHIPEAGREELSELYLDPIYIQHNPNATTGREGFREYFSQRPDSPIEATLEDPLVAMVAEGDVVVQVLQEERPHPDKPDELYYLPWFDMFRVYNGRLAEHWDTASKGELPASMQQQE